MESSELKALHEQYRKAIEVVRDETLPDETREKAQAEVVELRRVLDENLISVVERREREEDEARARAEEVAHQVAASPPEPAEPSSGELYRRWVSSGRPGTFSIAVMPDYASDFRAAGNKRVNVIHQHIDSEPKVEGRSLGDFSYVAKRTAADVERRTQVLTTDVATVYSGYLVPARTDRSLSWHENALSGILQAGPTIMQTPDDALLYMPKYLTDMTATHHNEGVTATVTSPVLARMELNAYRYDGFISVSTEMLRSSILDITGILQEGANRAIATAVAAALSAGDGSDLPQGLGGAATTTLAGKTASAATSFSLDDLKALKLSVLPGWRAQGSWVMGTNAYALLDQLKSDDGQYLWSPSNIAGEPNTLLGKPIYEDSGLPDITTATKGAVLFGDFSQYIVRYAGPVVFEASEQYSWPLFETTFRFAKWLDADLIQTSAIKHLLMA